MLPAVKRALSLWCFSNCVCLCDLENSINDRELMRHCRMRFDILRFVEYDLEEELRWHSALRSTRRLFLQYVFELAFTKLE